MSANNWVGRAIGGRYQIESLLGQGGMSAVYRAQDPNLRRAVAIKLIHGHLSTDPEFVRRFEQEAAAVAQLRHPNIIQVFDFNHDGEVYYMVLEYLAGETLQSRLKALHAAGERLGLAQAVAIMATIADAVEYAHRRGMIHRDLKPANVMLDPQGQPILMDFGVAKIVGGQQHTATGAIVGTVAYMSPEQIRGLKVDERADIYSLGIMLFEMTAGRPPFEGDSAMTVMFKHVNEPPPDIHQFNAGVPDELKAVISKALAKEPGERFQTAAEFAQELRTLRLTLTAVRPPLPETNVSAPPPTKKVETKPEPASPPVVPVTPPPTVTAATSASTPPPTVVPAAGAEPAQTPAVETRAPVPPPPVRPSLAAAAEPAKPGSPPLGLILGLGVVAVLVVVGIVVGGMLTGGDRGAGTATQTQSVAAAATATQPPAAATATTAPTVEPTVTLAPTAAPLPTDTATPEPTPTATAVPVPNGMALIPAGTFNMGSDAGQADERPVHAVTLRPFFLDVFEVTNARYRACVEAGQCQAQANRNSFTRASYATLPEYDNFPAVQVTWDQAVAFCAFEGKRLPTEAEWEYAARGGADQRYPWGNDFDPARVPARVQDTVAVGTLDNASAFGVFDLPGNVNEWVADFYSRTYYAESPAENPAGPADGSRRVFRGGSFGNADGSFYTASRRYNQAPGFRDADIGFRCAQDAP